MEIVEKVDGKETKIFNPAYEAWVTTDQQVLDFLLSSLTKEALQQVATSSIAALAWKAIEDTYGSHIQAHSMNTRIALATTQKGNISIKEYVTRMRTLGDEMDATGKVLDDEELVPYILARLNHEYNPVVPSILARVEPIKVGELLSHLFVIEHWLDLLIAQRTTNVASRGWGTLVN